ncbi:hypothetical protein DBZ36_13105 [Alginatibacterium sediminis]|uniref:Uncharacterized protein n=1 Tax=Alginatibacterium sediminis TaxID=2164068 RepID=A0A420E9P0_9ALTE|nr:hypothetical protein [Alginatibacterium sediminis]RKF17391.1 hypothetical protein DBZ36_13105 [Alginatibacterium sediminis]
MKTVLLFSVLLFAFNKPLLASNEPEFYDSIRTLEKLLSVVEEPIETYAFQEQGMEFTHFFSIDLNRSFIVNDELGEVCSTYVGRQIESCFPCQSQESSENCP